jgi:phage tail tape-measure protein
MLLGATINAMEAGMTAKNDEDASALARATRIEHEAEGAASVALVGAVVGAAAGPAGAVAGALIGGLAGAVVGAVLDEEASKRTARTRELDAEIGVTGGDIGAPNLKHPPAKVGAYSAAAAGASPSSADEHGKSVA